MVTSAAVVVRLPQYTIAFLSYVIEFSEVCSNFHERIAAIPIILNYDNETRREEKKKERGRRNGKTKWIEFYEMLERKACTTLRKFCSPKKRRWFNAQKARREKVKICRKNRAKQRRACTSKIHARRYLLAVITRSRKTRCGSILVLVTPFCIVRQTFTLMQ